MQLEIVDRCSEALLATFRWCPQTAILIGFVSGLGEGVEPDFLAIRGRAWAKWAGLLRRGHGGLAAIGMVVSRKSFFQTGITTVSGSISQLVQRYASGAANSWSEARAEAIGGRLQAIVRLRRALILLFPILPRIFRKLQ